MNRRQRRQQGQRGRHTAPSGLIDPQDVPPGFVVFGDGLGDEVLVYAPEMVEAMRHDCPLCQGE